MAATAVVIFPAFGAIAAVGISDSEPCSSSPARPFYSAFIVPSSSGIAVEFLPHSQREIFATRDIRKVADEMRENIIAYPPPRPPTRNFLACHSLTYL